MPGSLLLLVCELYDLRRRSEFVSCFWKDFCLTVALEVVAIVLRNAQNRSVATVPLGVRISHQPVTPSCSYRRCG